MPVEPELSPITPMSPSIPEFRIVGEIAQAFLTAKQPNEVYRIALDRVAPLVGASFACVFLRDGESDLLRIVAAHNWPQRYAAYLGSMRVRVGNGPTGRAVLNNELVDVADLFADPELEDWWESARELGFSASIALPLSFEATPIGSLTFYFRDADAFHVADRSLLRLVAHQLAGTAEKAHLIEDLERANARLKEQNSALEQRYQEADEAKRVKNEFLANVSHELRTPLTAVLGYTHLLKEELTGPLTAEQVAAIHRIEVAGNQLLSLIEGLLDLTTVMVGNVRAEPELCDAVALARTAVANAGTPPTVIELRSEVPPDQVPVHTDPQLVLRVLHSLLSNALKFTPAGSITLRVRTEEPTPSSAIVYPRGPDIVWEVCDTGIGIEPANHELIFDEFRQADGSATRRYGGAGLGLAIARRLARKLGGDIRVESSLGAGARFLFTLPAFVVRAGSG